MPAFGAAQVMAEEKPPTTWSSAYSGNYTSVAYSRGIQYVVIHADVRVAFYEKLGLARPEHRSQVLRILEDAVAREGDEIARSRAVATLARAGEAGGDPARQRRPGAEKP